MDNGGRDWTRPRGGGLRWLGGLSNQRYLSKILIVSKKTFVLSKIQVSKSKIFPKFKIAQPKQTYEFLPLVRNDDIFKYVLLKT